MKRLNTLNGKYLRVASLIVLLVCSCAFYSMAQHKKHHMVRVEVISVGDKDKVMVDTAYVSDVMAFTMDSLHAFDFNKEDLGAEEIEKMHIEMERLLKEKGMAFDEMAELFKQKPCHFYWSEDTDSAAQHLDVETIVKEDGEQVKVITRTINVKGDDPDGDKKVKTFVIRSSDAPAGGKLGVEETKVTLESIPMEDISIIRKAGVDETIIFNEPIKVEKIKVMVLKEITDTKENTVLTLEMELPEGGNFELKMVDKEGQLKEHDKKVKSGHLKKEFHLNKDQEPYYLMLLRNNQIFGRKVEI